MLLIIFLGLIVTLLSFPGTCDLLNEEMNDFDWYKVRISVLTRFQLQAVIKRSTCVLYFICGSIKEFSIDHIRLYV